MNNSTTISLISCIKGLGLRQGWAYWKLLRKCQDNPQTIEDWASRCSKVARSLRIRNNIEIAEKFEEFEAFLLQELKEKNPQHNPSIIPSH